MDSILGYAGAVAAFFAILNYLKMREPALKSYITTNTAQKLENRPIAVTIASENTTNNPFHHLELNAEIGMNLTSYTTLGSLKTKMQLGPKGTMYHTIEYLDRLKDLGYIDKATNKKINEDSEDLGIVVSMHYKYRRSLLKKSISQYFYWNHKKGWWSPAEVAEKGKAWWQFWR